MFKDLCAAHNSIDDEGTKERWRKAGGRVARRLAKDLGGKASWNPGGIAVEGDHSVITPTSWIQLCGWAGRQSFLYRKASPEDKYGTRSSNCWAPLPSTEEEYQALLVRVRAL